MTETLDVGCHLNVLVPDLADGPRLDAALAAIAGAGCRRVVLPPLDPAATDTPALRRRFERHGLTPITIAGQAPGALVGSDDAEERAAGAALLRDALDLTEALGGDQMNGVPYGLFGPPDGPISPETLRRSAVEVGRVAEAAHARGIMMTFEVLNRYETAMINTAAQAMAYAELSESAHLRIHLDTFHMAVEEADPLAAVELAMPRLGYLELGQSGRGPLATGAVDVVELVRHARRAGYAGRLGVEAFSRPLLATEAADGLRIWRTVYEDGAALLREAMSLIDRAA